MASLTRRGFLKKTSVGVAAGALAALPGTALAADLAKRSVAEGTETLTAAPFVVHVRNPAAGEMAVLVDTEEFILTDRALAARLWQARGSWDGASTRASTPKVR